MKKTDIDRLITSLLILQLYLAGKIPVGAGLLQDKNG